MARIRIRLRNICEIISRFSRAPVVAKPGERSSEQVWARDYDYRIKPSIYGSSQVDGDLIEITSSEYRVPAQRRIETVDVITTSDSISSVGYDFKLTPNPKRTTGAQFTYQQGEILEYNYPVKAIKREQATVKTGQSDQLKSSEGNYRVRGLQIGAAQSGNADRINLAEGNINVAGVTPNNAGVLLHTALLLQDYDVSVIPVPRGETDVRFTKDNMTLLEGLYTVASPPEYADVAPQDELLVLTEANTLVSPVERTSSVTITTTDEVITAAENDYILYPVDVITLQADAISTTEGDYAIKPFDYVDISAHTSDALTLSEQDYSVVNPTHRAVITFYGDQVSLYDGGDYVIDPPTDAVVATGLIDDVFVIDAGSYSVNPTLTVSAFFDIDNLAAKEYNYIIIPTSTQEGTATYIELEEVSIRENLPPDSKVGNIYSDGPSGTVYSVGGPDWQSFDIRDMVLYSNEVFDYETKQYYDITLIAENGGSVYSEPYTIYISDIVEGLTDHMSATMTYAKNQTFGAWTTGYDKPVTIKFTADLAGATGIIIEKGALDQGFAVWTNGTHLLARMGAAGTETSTDTLFAELTKSTITGVKEYLVCFIPGNPMQIRVYFDEQIKLIREGGSFPVISSDVGGGYGIKGGSTVPPGCIDQTYTGGTLGDTVYIYYDQLPSDNQAAAPPPSSDSPESPSDAPPAPSSNTVTSQYIEAETGTIGASWRTATESGISYIQPTSYASTEPTLPDHVVSFTTAELEGGDYKIWFKVQNYGSSGDAFYIKVDDGVWRRCNNLSSVRPTGAYYWNAAWVEDDPSTHLIFNVAQGAHTVQIGRRENVKIDKIYITKNNDDPSVA